MSKHNYTQYSNKHNDNNPNKANRPNNKPAQKVEVAKPKTVEPKPVVEPMVESVETVSLPATVEGVVVNCAKLNVREKPSTNSDVICVLDVMSEIQVDVSKSTTQWVYVYTATGVEGYCMREYIDAHL